MGKILFEDPELAEAMLDPDRVFNQDECKVEVGAGHAQVLAKVGAPGPRLKMNVTISLTLSASGDNALVRLVYAGKNKIRSDRLKDLPEDGTTGKWHVTLSERGYMTMNIFYEVAAGIGSSNPNPSSNNICPISPDIAMECDNNSSNNNVIASCNSSNNKVSASPDISTGNFAATASEEDLFAVLDQQLNIVNEELMFVGLTVERTFASNDCPDQWQ